MSKRNNISYIKPADPKFLQQLKAEIGGYNSGPTIDTKRQKLDIDSDSDRSDIDDEAPQVVVLRKGDLTAEEADQEQKLIEKEETEKPADLRQRILFKSKPSEKSTAAAASSSSSISETTSNKKDKKRPSRPEVSKNKLSFQIEDEENEDNE